MGILCRGLSATKLIAHSLTTPRQTRYLARTYYCHTLFLLTNQITRIIKTRPYTKLPVVLGCSDRGPYIGAGHWTTITSTDTNCRMSTRASRKRWRTYSTGMWATNREIAPSTPRPHDSSRIVLEAVRRLLDREVRRRIASHEMI